MSSYTIPVGRVKGDKPKGTFGLKKPFPKYNKNKNRKGSKKVSVIAEGRGVKVSRLKLKFCGGNDTFVTVLEQEFMDWLHSEEQFRFYSCVVCCRLECYEDSIDWHHIKRDSTDKKNHKKQIPVCHNRCHLLGKELSVHGTPVKFREKFSWKVQNEIADDIFDRFIFVMEYSEEDVLRLDVKKEML